MLHITPMTLRGAEESPIPGSGVRIGRGSYLAAAIMRRQPSGRGLGSHRWSERRPVISVKRTKKKKKLANVVVACISLYKGTCALVSLQSGTPASRDPSTSLKPAPRMSI